MPIFIICFRFHASIISGSAPHPTNALISVRYIIALNFVILVVLFSSSAEITFDLFARRTLAASPTVRRYVGMLQSVDRLHSRQRIWAQINSLFAHVVAEAADIMTSV
jgi:hypothetical protein